VRKVIIYWIKSNQNIYAI